MSEFFSWYLVISSIGWLALPLAFRLFGRLPDRGYSFSRPLGLLVSGYIFWILATLGVLYNDTGGILAACALILLGGTVWLGRAGRFELVAWLRKEIKSVVAIEVFFLAAFGLWALVRAYNPEIIGTEKPMEFMFINSILRSPSFPPHDAWLSEHAISYYYFGYVLIAMLTRLTGVAASVGFNLGIAALFALSGVGALGMVMNLVALARRKHKALLSSFWPGLLAPLMVLLVGNYYGALEMAHHNGALAQVQVPAVWYDFGQPPADRPPASLQDFIRPPGIQAGWINLWEWLDLKRINTPPAASSGPLRWDLPYWFFAARVVHDRGLTGVETEAIDENPAFSFLLGDIHPHVLALPFVILAAGLALEWLLWAYTWASQEGVREERRSAGAASRSHALQLSPWQPRLLLTAIITGSLLFLNTWDFPIYWFLIVLAFAAGIGVGQGWTGMLQLLGRIAYFAVSLAVLSLVLYLPYFLTFQTQAGGFLPNAFYPTRFQQSIVMFGPLMAWVTLFVLAAVWRWRAWFSWMAALWTGFGLIALLVLIMSAMTAAVVLSPGLASQIEPVVAPLSLDQAVRLMLQRRLVDSLATVFPALILGAAAGLAAGLVKGIRDRDPAVESVQTGSEQKEAEDPGGQFLAGRQPVQEGNMQPMPEIMPVLMVLLMALTGAMLLLGPEYIYLRDYFNTRMNTLFKFYFQVWALWGLASAFAIWYVWNLIRQNSPNFSPFALWVTRFTWGVAAAAVLPGLVYLPGALLSKTNHFTGPPTLDGMAYFVRDYPDDWAAVQWLAENTSGRPVILEGSRGSYWSEGRSSRISMITGLPTVMGWPWHEQQWRGEYFNQVRMRSDQIQQAYSLRDWSSTQTILDGYQVEYIIVSPLETSWYGVYQPKFERYLEPVFKAGSLTVYRYLPSGQ